MATTSPLRQRMIEDMTIRNLSRATQQSYIYAVARFSRHFNLSPDRLGMEEIRAYQLHLVAEKHSWGHINQVTCALRFFYGITLGQKEAIERIVFGREPEKLPPVEARDLVGIQFAKAINYSLKGWLSPASSTTGAFASPTMQPSAPCAASRLAGRIGPSRVRQAATWPPPSIHFLERLTAAGLQYCIVDPEGDYEGFEDAVSVGDAHQPPSLSKVVELLERPGQNVAVNLLGVVLHDRPNVLVGLLAALLQLRERTGRPHWIVVDEAHHMLPQELVTAGAPLAANSVRMMFVTVHPDHMARSVLASVDWLVALGKTVKDTMRSFAAAARTMLPRNCPIRRPRDAPWSGMSRPAIRRSR